MTTTVAVAAPRDRRRSTLRIYAAESWCELLKVLRLPAYAIPTLAFPAMFYLLFGILFGAGKSYGSGIGVGTYLLATYGAFGVIGAALFGFGVGVAIERGQGWLLLKRASPMPPGAYFAAKIFMAVVFSVLIVALLYALGLFVGDVAFEPLVLVELAGVLIAGALPFCAFGLLLGTVAGPNSAPAIVNLIYLPMAFVSGLWIPIDFLPTAVQKIALALPAYHFAQLALKILDADRGQSVLLHVGYLLAFSALALVGATIAFRRDEDKTYG